MGHLHHLNRIQLNLLKVHKRRIS